MFQTMPNGKDAVTTHLDADEKDRLGRFMRAHGYEAKSNGVRKAMNKGLREWERSHDPAQSWLLNIGLASMLWAILAVVGSIRIGTPPWDIAAFSVVMAFVFLTAHAVQVARQRWGFGLGQLTGAKQ